ncbi:MAG: type II secretion system protein [Candidatus Eremiobacteraeota bacterium]|nr:type II secretion system protein [Candidatus Eremiobacteraeota bacterium]
MRRRGMSLLETLLAGTLLTMVMGLALSFLIPTFRNSSRGGLRVEMQQQASIALERLVIDLEHGAPASVSILPAPTGTDEVSGVAVQRMEGYTSSGSQLWEMQLIFYYWLPKTGTLKREIWKNGMNPSLSVTLLDYHPAHVTRQDLLAVINDGSSPESNLARGVTKFSVDYPAPPYQQPYRIQLTLERSPIGQKAPEVLTLDRSITLRNLW